MSSGHGCSLPGKQVDYGHGAQARLDDEPFDEEQSKCWQDGWQDMNAELQPQPEPA